MISISFKNLFWHYIGNLWDIYNIARDVINKKKKKIILAKIDKQSKQEKKYIYNNIILILLLLDRLFV